jgi:hypothetical protein
MKGLSPPLSGTFDVLGNRASTSSARAVGLSISKENFPHPSERVEGCVSRLSTVPAKGGDSFPSCFVRGEIMIGNDQELAVTRKRMA